jgi:hypothetical protein
MNEAAARGVTGDALQAVEDAGSPRPESSYTARRSQMPCALRRPRPRDAGQTRCASRARIAQGGARHRTEGRIWPPQRAVLGLGRAAHRRGVLPLPGRHAVRDQPRGRVRAVCGPAVDGDEKPDTCAGARVCRGRA